MKQYKIVLSTCTIHSAWQLLLDRRCHWGCGQQAQNQTHSNISYLQWVYSTCRKYNFVLLHSNFTLFAKILSRHKIILFLLSKFNLDTKIIVKWLVFWASPSVVVVALHHVCYYSYLLLLFLPADCETCDYTISTSEEAPPDYTPAQRFPVCKDALTQHSHNTHTHSHNTHTTLTHTHTYSHNTHTTLTQHSHNTHTHTLTHTHTHSHNTHTTHTHSHNTHTTLTQHTHTHTHTHSHAHDCSCTWTTYRIGHTFRGI